MARVKEAVLNMNLLIMAWGVEHYYETHNGDGDEPSDMLATNCGRKSLRFVMSEIVALALWKQGLFSRPFVPDLLSPGPDVTYGLAEKALIEVLENMAGFFPSSTPSPSAGPSPGNTAHDLVREKVLKKAPWLVESLDALDVDSGTWQDTRLQVSSVSCSS
ncbi:unnamed protein product [Symbiodinium necroappetens]|uniref:Uncharacterized protein n=1 Tax=Symbiodinium necroappetens TaxID=1628268 RepID=A0A813A0H2_9DINO|nr:unnamed protein product [Symbiodinium necroappetens]